MPETFVDGLGHDDTDAARQRCSLSDDLAPRRGNIVAAAGRDRTHVDDDRLFSIEQRKFTPDQIACQCRAAGRVDVEDDGIQAFIPARRANLLLGRGAADEVTAEQWQGHRKAATASRYDGAFQTDHADATSHGRCNMIREQTVTLAVGAPIWRAWRQTES